MRTIPCLLAIGCLAAADPFDADEFRTFDLGGTALVAVYEHPLDNNFTVGSIHGNWDHADRIGGEVRIFQSAGRSVPMESWGGLFMAWDTRHGSFNGGTGSLDVDAFMVMAEGGVSGNLLPAKASRFVALQASFFGRLGMGFQDGYVTGYQTPFGPADGALAPIRYEIAIGAEVQATITRRIYAFAGVGITWFMANQATYVSAGGSGSTVAVSAQGIGTEGFGRFGGGFRF